MSQAERLYHNNKLLFGKFYFPHYFRRGSPPFHIQIIKQCSSGLFTAIQAPRGSAKSTVTTFLDTIHGITLKRERFIVIVQNTYAKAAGSLNNIKYEFRYNEKLKTDFGITMGVKDAEGDTIFSSPASGDEPAFMCRVLCKGADQLGSIRGERFGAYRPTLIIVDDIEDDEMVKNPERRMELEKQFNEVLNYAGEARETRIIVDGTILHDDSLLAKMISPDKYQRFSKLVYQARTVVDGVAVSLWPEKWSVEDLAEMEADNPEAFAKEMQGDPSSGSLETILRADFRRWEIVEGMAVLYGGDGQVSARWSLKECKAGIGIDLAWEDGQVNDSSAFVPGIVTPANDLLFDSYVVKKGMRPNEWESLVFELSERYQAMTGKRVCIGIEKAKYEKVMKWFLSEAQKRRNQWLWFKDVQWGTKDKIERIMTRLANRYANHSVYHRDGMGVLENQLIRLRSTPHDDVADAAAMIPEILAFAPVVAKAKQPEDLFRFLQKQTNAWRGRERRDSRYVFGNKRSESVVESKVGLVASSGGLGF